ncbi:MAG: RNA pseudouridine synthase [Spirochaetia bacterium]|nr:RNA pseudouridine synthase [Spirochaetia bacterium]
MLSKKKDRNRLPQGVKLIHEDRNLIIVDKPPGLLTVSTQKEKFKTVYSILSDTVKRTNPRNKIFIIHRLDKDTSGILIFAKSEKMKKAMQNQWETCEKEYLALIEGCPEKTEDTIVSYLAENKMKRVYSTKDSSSGKLSKTFYRVIKKKKKMSLVKVKLLTGRKHQIRVHFADLGHPVLGDQKYGKGKESSVRLALHAYSISFFHPVEKKDFEYKTDLPVFLKNFTDTEDL